MMRHRFSGKILGGLKQKHKKTALEQSGMLRIWRRDCQISQTILHGRDATLRVRAKYSIWYKIIGGREVSRPYQVWFFAEGDLFFMFLFQSPQYFSTEPMPHHAI